MIQINATVRLPSKVAHGIKTAFVIEVAAIAMIVLSVALVAFVLFSIWAEL